MDQKQFERMQTGIQWAVDEQRQHSNLRHYQGLWAYGIIKGPVDTNEVITTSNVYGTQVQVTEVCATACCLAGNVVIAHGDRIVEYVFENGLEGRTTDANHCLDGEGNLRKIATRAKELMGLTDVEAQVLFSGDNSVDALIRTGEHIAARHGHTLTII